MKIVLIVCFLIIGIFSPVLAFAHDENQKSYLYVSGKLTDHYKINQFSYKDLIIPKDDIDRSFVPGEEIVFKIDSEVLDIPEEMKYEENILWDFGNGSKASGFLVDTTYTRPGTYYVTIKASFSPDRDPVLVDSIFINVFNKDYKFPKYEVFVDGKKIEENTVTELDFKKPIKFNVKSEDNSLRFIWDLGDTTTSNLSELSKTFDNNHFFVHPILRVSDKNGIISDFYFSIKNLHYVTPSPEGEGDNKVNAKMLILFTVIVMGLLIFLIFIAENKKRLLTKWKK